MAMNTNKLQDNTLESHQFSEVESVQELDSVQDLNLPQERGYEAPLARNYSLAPKFLIGNVSLKSFKSMQSSRSLHPSLRHKQPSLSYLQQKTLLWDEKEKNDPFSEHSIKGKSRSKSNSSKMTKNTDIMKTGMSIGIPKMDSMLVPNNGEKQRDIHSFKTVVHPSSSGLAVPTSHRHSMHTVADSLVPHSPQLLNISVGAKEVSPTATSGTRTNTHFGSAIRNPNSSNKLSLIEADPLKKAWNEPRPDYKFPAPAAKAKPKLDNKASQNSLSPMLGSNLGVSFKTDLAPARMPMAESFPLARRGTGRPED